MTGGFAVLALAAVAATAPAAHAASLPTVSSGEPPGPPLLYENPPPAPQLSVDAPFAAPPLLVSGTDAYRDGEYLYQDYLFDDRGADTVPGPGARIENGRNAASPTAGDAFYPTADRFGGNAADLVEFRVKPTADAIVYRVTLNTLRAAAVPAVGIGIDTDRAGEQPVDWPRGAGLTSPGLDYFITAWADGGELTTFSSDSAVSLPAGAVSVDPVTNQIVIRVPRSLLDPGTATWRHVAGAGLWDGDGWKPLRAGATPTEEHGASGNPLRSSPAVFNLAFRFDEPQGHWFEDEQAAALGEGTSGGFHADIDFGALAGGADGWLHGPGPLQARIHASRFEPYEGVQSSFPAYGTRLQPYMLSVPSAYAREGTAPLTLFLHAGNSSYTQYAVSNPNLYAQLGEERGSFVLTPLARATDTFYTGIAEADVYEAWGDVARQFALDSERVALGGYSIGGYGAYRMAVHHPDLFGRVFTGVAQPGIQVWVPPAPPAPGGQVTNTNPLLENARWVPFLNWAQAIDEINPYTGPRAQQDRFNALGLRSQLWTYTNGDHFLLAINDQWESARDFLGEAVVERDPSRVDYAFMPQADTPAFGLRHDHSYWVHGLEARDTEGDPQTAPARGFVSARSLAFGEGEPETRRVTGPPEDDAQPTPTTIDGVVWDGIPSVAPSNALHVDLENISSATVDGRRALLDGEHALRVTIESDGPGELRLELPLPRRAVVVRVDARAGDGAAAQDGWDTTLDQAGATFSYRAGVRTYEIRPSQAGSRPERNPNDQRKGAGGRLDEDAPGAGQGESHGADGLPFTGLGLGCIAVCGAAAVAAGLRARRVR